MPDPMSVPQLDPSRWQQLWLRLGSEAPPGSFAELQAAYRQPSRHYHGEQHILACLRHLDRHRALAAEPDQLELALWLHDLVYDSRRQDNEAASAEQARRWLEQAGLEALASKIEALILATCHQAPASSPDEALLVDIDLAILASAPAVYARYEADVRAEYAWVPEPLFRAGRSKLLREFLAMPRIFQRDELAAGWEKPARENLATALRLLEG